MSGDLFYDTLPKAFPKSETMSYFRGASTYTRDDIIVGNMRLVSSIVTSYKVSDEDKKDLFQIGLIGLMKAVDKFDISKGTQFANFAATCIQNEIGTYLRKANRDNLVISIEEPIHTDNNGTELKINDILVDESADIVDNFENKEAINLLKELVVSLSVKDSFIVTLYFGLFDNEPVGQKEIAFRLNISQSYISRLINKILSNLKELILNPPKQRKRRGNKGNSIFKLLKDYNRDLVWEVIYELNEEDRILLYLRCGRDLDNPIPSPFWNENTAYKFNVKLMPKIKRKLEEKLWWKDHSPKVVELTPMEKYKREKINEIHNLLINMDMVNAQIVLHDYLVDSNLIQYESFLVSLIILSVMDKDFTFQAPIRNLVLLENGYEFDALKYKDYFYESLMDDIAQVPLYLDIIRCLQKSGMSDISVDPLEKAYLRVLEQKK